MIIVGIDIAYFRYVYKLLLFFILFATPLFVFSQKDSVVNIQHALSELEKEKLSIEEKLDLLNKSEEKLKLKLIQFDMNDIGLPLGKDDQIIRHKAMVISYNESHEQANWVMHQILPDVATGNFSRSNDFRVDSLVATGSSIEQDYFVKQKDAKGETVYDGFGFDRGHLAPSADFRWSASALSESYFYSNMSPQDPLLNREKWAELEGAMRAYVIDNKVTLTVVTGPVLSDNLKKISRSVNQVSVPEYLYKVVYDAKNQRTIGFIMPNGYCKHYLRKYAVSVDSVETLTGLDFFPNREDKLEASFDYKVWLPKDAQDDEEALSVSALPRGAINTEAAKEHINTGKKQTVCGTVVSAKKSGKGNVFLNLDKSFPNHVFSITIWSSDVPNFSYAPHEYLMKKEVCVTGKIGDHQGVPSMNIDKEEAIKILSK